MTVSPIWVTSPPTTVGSSTTPVSQAGILYGHSGPIPGYRWWDRRGARLVEASDAEEMRRLEATLGGPYDLLAGGGASVTNVFSGGAPTTLFTVSHMQPLAIAADLGDSDDDPDDDDHNDIPTIVSIPVILVLLPARYVHDTLKGVVFGVASGFVSDLNILTGNASVATTLGTILIPFKTNALPRDS